MLASAATVNDLHVSWLQYLCCRAASESSFAGRRAVVYHRVCESSFYDQRIARHYDGPDGFQLVPDK
ncbi:hypothetical protein KCP73_14770 [Salmonella enterica subsp. enterica]|nr:hypothetical protein KCP73_14770 [Salmonella enterica subsp. enterica]